MTQIVDQHAISDAPQPEPRIIDIPIRITGLLTRILYFIVFLILVALAISQVSGFIRIQGSGLGAVAMVYGCAILVSMLLGVIPAIQRRRALRRVGRLLHAYDELDDQDPQGLAERVYKGRGWMERNAGLVLVIVGMSSRQPGLVFRFAPRKQHVPIDPLNMSFEARPLDETEPTFTELWNATLPSDAEGEATLRPLPGPEQPVGLRRVMRNVRLKEGRFMTLVFLALFASSAYDDFRDARITIWTIIWAVFLARVFFAPVTRDAKDGMWFIVPRGILIRQVNEKKEVVHRLLDRVTSVLGVFMNTRHQWSIVVSDESGTYSHVATANEVTLLLRSWTSNVEPPSEDVIANIT